MRDDQPALLWIQLHARTLQLRECHPLRCVIPDDFVLGASAIALALTPHLP